MTHARHRIAVVVGTRPEIIKMAPVVDEVSVRFGPEAPLLIDTGQHYDAAMSGVFWRELGLAVPDVRLDGGGRSRADCVGYLTSELGRVFANYALSAVLVQGDTNSTVAGALAANALMIPLVHVEAGLRSHDRAMPEEHNRVVTDHLADLCCAASEANVTSLRAEGIVEDRIMLTGNTIVESVARELPPEAERQAALDERGLRRDGYVLATVHRPENTDDCYVLRQILLELDAIAQAGLPVLFPMHPRTASAITEAGLSALLDALQVIEPVGARTFLSLAAHAAVLVSDSGGIAEEVTVLKRPLVVVRRSTERAESIAAGFAQLVEPAGIQAAVASIMSNHAAVLDRLATTASPYGDGRAAARIAWATKHLIQADTASDSERTEINRQVA